MSRLSLSGAGALFRISGTMALGLCLVEGAGFSVRGVSLSPVDLVIACAVALAASAAYALAASLLGSFLGADLRTMFKLTSLAGSLALLYLVMVLWLKSWAFLHGSGWIMAAAYLIMMGVFMALGRMLWIYFNTGDPDLDKSRYQALAPMSVVCIGLYSIAVQSVGQNRMLVIAVLGIIVLFMAGQYLLIRFIWTRKKKRFQRWVVRGHLAVIVVVPLTALGFRAVDFHRSRKPATAPADMPSVILITVDTQRADFISSNNPQTVPTPAVDGLAQDGIRFANAMSPAAWTAPSVASIITGLDPTACGAGTLIPGKIYDYTGPIEGVQTLAEVFEKQGYLTAAFVGNGWLTRSRGYAQGFQHYEMANDTSVKNRLLFSRAFDLIMIPFRSYQPQHGQALTDRALDWLSRRPAGPFFLWIHYIDPHMPYLAHEEYPPATQPTGPMTVHLVSGAACWIKAEIFGFDEKDRQYIRERYGAEVRFTDDQIARLFNSLRREGIYRNTVIGFTSDHGEEFWEHGGFEHGHGFYDELIHVPLIVKLPGNGSAGAVIDSRVDAARIGATLLQAAGVQSDYPGLSLLTCLDRPSCTKGGDDRGVWFSEKTLYALERGAVGDYRGHKAIFHGDGSLTCYDLQVDPKEQNGYKEGECPWPDDLPAPRELLETVEKSGRDTFASLGGEEGKRKRAPEAELRMLRALGYIK